MTGRDRFVKALQGAQRDRPPFPSLFFPIHSETLRRWHRDGMPRDVHPIQHFQLDRIELIPVTTGPVPHYERARLEDAEEWKLGVERDIKSQVDPEIAVAEEEFPIQTVGDWNRFSSLLNPESPSRYPRFWTDYARHEKDRDYPLGISLGGLVGWLLEWMGRITLSKILSSDPAFLCRILEELVDFQIRVWTRALTDIEADFAIIWEGTVYRAQLLLDSPELKETLRNQYRRLNDFLEEKGIRVRIVHFHGRADGFGDLWWDAGWTAFAPLTAGAADPFELRKRYGDTLGLIGGLDRRLLGASKREMRELVRWAKILWEEIHCLPAPDGPLLADIPYENFRDWLSAFRRELSQ
ncbi:MAG: hypothetical protein NZ959_10955 [Armatimonadetes bacterium]|nr:hypothetical protein [Armatimonadota bacterium]MDW8122888.1 hypothetical protein [Armatimonadota bacterium]